MNGAQATQSGRRGNVSRSLHPRQASSKQGEFYFAICFWVSPFEGLISGTNVMSVLFQRVEYLIHWEGYSAFSATWESEDVSVDLIRCVGLCLVHSFIVTIKQRKDITESGDIKEENHH